MEKEILITNDDGINAAGLHALYKQMRKAGNVTIVAPDVEKSAVGHAITLCDPLRIYEIKRNGKIFGFAVNGTPADCVKIAVNVKKKKMPDIVISGINHGPNTGVNVIYSGTVSAATEAAILGIPSFAISLASKESTDFSFAAIFAGRIAKKILQMGLPVGTFLNVNVPPGKKEEIKGVQITSQGKGRFIEEFEERTDPAKKIYYWMKGKKTELDDSDNTDEKAVRNGNVSVTPVHFDLTNYRVMNEFKLWKMRI